MRQLLSFIFILISFVGFAQKKYVLVIHGGAGNLSKESLTTEKEEAYRAKLTEALQAGYSKIKTGQSSIKAVQAAIIVLEDSPLFNAGRGAVFTHDGKNELDASIMYGKTKSAGAVAGVTTIKNPITAANAVMQHSPHVMLSGQGAETFAKEQHLDIVPNSYFFTQDRWDALQKAIEKEKKQSTSQLFEQEDDFLSIDQKFGTVGAVALDKDGNITAGTSTGGMTNKKWNRIGDSPVIGAGTYANAQVGVSGTGWGEFFIRSTAGRTVAALMEYQNKDVKSASQEVINEIETLGGSGGIIALDNNGNVAMPFNTTGMFRGTITENGEITVEIFK